VADAEALYRLLEEQIVPLLCECDAYHVPRRWVKIVKDSIRTVARRFNARRTVKQYPEEVYVPMARRAFSADMVPAERD
jgi:glycogen phosphorylase